MTPQLRPLVPAFYERRALDLAPLLVGKILVVRTEDGISAGRIVETEAYEGPEDLAAHSAGGRRTKRTEVMYGPAGHAYMFLLYGTSWAFNIVAATPDVPHAVLVRAVEPVAGIDAMVTRRGMAAGRRELCNGPGKLCKALGLTGAHYGQSLASDTLYIAEGPPARLGKSPRINVDYAGAWAKRAWRFYERGNRYVSVAPRH